LIQVDVIAVSCLTQANQVLLRGVQATLSVQHAQIAVDTAPESGLRQGLVGSRSLHQRFLGAQLLAQRSPSGQRIGNFPKGIMYCLLVRRQSHIAIRLGNIQAGTVASSVEDRKSDLRHEVPEACSAIK